jgi:hypothetical protein
MSRTSGKLQALQIYNPHNAASYAAKHGGLGVYLHRRLQQPGRGFVSAAWQVCRPGYKTNPDGHWQDNGHQTFTIGLRHTAAEAETAAKAWAEERYGITEWAKIPGLRRAWFPAGDAAIVEAAVKEAAR